VSFSLCSPMHPSDRGPFSTFQHPDCRTIGTFDVFSEACPDEEVPLFFLRVLSFLGRREKFIPLSRHAQVLCSPTWRAGSVCQILDFVPFVSAARVDPSLPFPDWANISLTARKLRTSLIFAQLFPKRYLTLLLSGSWRTSSFFKSSPDG